MHTPLVLFVDAFFVSKSENRNQVHYAVVVDDDGADCSTRGSSPAFARWKMLEKGPFVEEALLDREERAYGILSQTLIDAHRIRIVLRALPSRPVIVETFARAGACHASAQMTIGGASARLFNVHVALRWPFGIDHLLLQGWGDGDRVVREKVSP